MQDQGSWGPIRSLPAEASAQADMGSPSEARTKKAIYRWTLANKLEVYEKRVAIIVPLWHNFNLIVAKDEI